MLSLFEGKQCFKCGLLKPYENFYRHPKMADGHLNKCKKCARSDTQDNYKNNIEHYKKYERFRNQKLSRKTKKLEYERARRKKYPERYKAYQRVYRAIEKGVLQRQPCEVCGRCKVEAHHENYSRPLDVKWLCLKHHRIEHDTWVQGD